MTIHRFKVVDRDMATDVARDTPRSSAAPEMTVPFVDLTAEHARYRGEIDAAIAAVLDTSSFILGDAVARFEQSFADYCGTRHAIGVDSGFSALELIIRAYNIGPGDEVITVANTFVATVAAIDSAGARPVLVDVDPVTQCVDVDALADAITSRTKAVIPVHLFGRVAEMEPVLELAGLHGLFVFEDACQAHGAWYQGRRAGSFGDASAFSFYPSKNLGALGDGGMITTNDDDVARRLRILRNVGSTEKYVHEMRGFNRRLDTLHAAVLDVKLTRLDDANRCRINAADAYSAHLADLPVSLPAPAEEWGHVYHLYVVEVEQRDQFQADLQRRGVATGVHYPIPIHTQPGYRWLGYGPGDFPHTERLARRIVSLPMFPTLDANQIAYVASAASDFFNGD